MHKSKQYFNPINTIRKKKKKKKKRKKLILEKRREEENLGNGIGKAAIESGSGIVGEE